ncbi:hypothetical protein AJ80_04531 [Polytolypa hystricis UAMH7299]|uniref:Peripheral subunit-binding (PSBD) domain-containing protein n=1 Tax=Polytolypa hystricis (strain UAMH7299) TaxID=1447883 RepID=A0A2B7Y237_POLH7|nr:hypothetical protein AJ80_04531 [Polytolypa hystricis UAMH7299]
MASFAPVSRLPRCMSRVRVGSYNVARYIQTSSGSYSYPLYPSVAQLLHEHGIPASDAPKIPTSGPKGRLLKGDVLAYVGAIASDHPSNLSAQLSKLSHLDLSNIKLAPPPAPVPEQQSEPSPEAVAPPEPAPAPAQLSVTVPISLSSIFSIQERIHKKLGVAVPLSTFLTRAADIANDDLPVSKKSLSRSPDALFDEIIGAQKSPSSTLLTSRGNFTPEISSPEELSLPQQQPKTTQEPDIIDILTGNAQTVRAKAPPTQEELTTSSISEDIATNLFSVTVSPDDKARGKEFLERMRTLLQDQPGSLIF